MRVGCPKEIKNHEYRVGLTPPQFVNMWLMATKSGLKQRQVSALVPMMPVTSPLAQNYRFRKRHFREVRHDREGQGAAACRMGAAS